MTSQDPPQSDDTSQTPMRPTCSPPTDSDLIRCPIHHVPGIEKKQKWFCPICGMLLQTCCD